jgi:predicted Fe-Mo cluster-binding NifX family protein
MLPPAGFSMRVAITVSQGRVSPVFDVSREAIVLEVDKRRVAASSQQALVTDDLLQKSQQLSNLGINTLVCGAISNEALEQLRAIGIDVIGFVTGEVDTVVEALVEGDLPNATLAMPGCQRANCGGFRRRRRHRIGRNRQ